MTFAVGTRLGPYEVTAPLGAGGMGEVYRAVDTNLRRQVAIKVLPAALAIDPDRLARFRREAELLASLSHPHIAVVHGLETSGEVTALVMELVEGETLAERLAFAPLPIEEALPIATQIAQALEAAHAQGIVHRDLKPANVKIRPDGTVKVLDFGLAKALEPQVLHGAPDDSPTITSPALTARGVILGTAAYMSPEQARGRVIDERADIWAFGCVLYEMLTGRRAFAGDDVQETLARVIERDPDWSALPAVVPPVLAMFIRRCLEKNPKRRLHAIADVRLALEGAFETDDRSGRTAVTAPRQRSWLAALAAAGLVGAASWAIWPRPEPAPISQFTYEIPIDQPLRSYDRTVIAAAPDGRSFVYNTAHGLYQRAMGDLTARVIPGTEEDASNPFFSPDGAWIGYWASASGELKRIPVSGGLARVITKASEPFGADWGADDVIVYAQEDGIWRVSAAGGTPARAVTADAAERIFDPQWLPGGRSVMFTVAHRERVEAPQVVAQPISGGPRVTLVEGATNGRYMPPGHLVYINRPDNALFGIRFDAGTVSIRGDPVYLVQGIAPSGNRWTAVPNFSVAGDGTLVYLEAVPPAPRRVVWVDRLGREEDVGIEPRLYAVVRLSPDGTRVALDDRNVNNDIWIWDLVAKTRARLTLGPLGAFYPIWSPDGERVLFNSLDGRISARAADDTGETAIIQDSIPGRPGLLSPYFVAPASGTLAARADGDIGLLSLTPGQTPVWLLADRSGTALNADLSPDGRWMAYESNESGRTEVYVRPFPAVDTARVAVSSNGGFQPVWSRTGRELFFLSGPGRLQPDSLHVATIEPAGPRVSIASRQRLLDWPYLSPVIMRGYDVSPDGQRFLALKRTETEQPGPRRIVIVQQWLETMRRLIPDSR